MHSMHCRGVEGEALEYTPDGLVSRLDREREERRSPVVSTGHKDHRSPGTIPACRWDRSRSGNRFNPFRSRGSRGRFLDRPLQPASEISATEWARSVFANNSVNSETDSSRKNSHATPGVQNLLWSSPLPQLHLWFWLGRLGYWLRTHP